MHNSNLNSKNSTRFHHKSRVNPKGQLGPEPIEQNGYILIIDPLKVS